MSTVYVDHPSPRDAWRRMLVADQVMFAAIGTPGYDQAELEAQAAREAFADALARCPR